MHLTPEILAGCYEYFRLTPPFRRWRLPPADDVIFEVTKDCEKWGEQTEANGHLVIRVSMHFIGRTHSLMEVMAHEMCHLHCTRQGVKSAHGRDFRKCAALICEHHGFDPKIF